RLAVNLPVVFFADEGVSPVFGKVREEGTVLFMYSNGTWVQFGGDAKVGGTKTPIRFHPFAPVLRPTFKGTTAAIGPCAAHGPTACGAGRSRRRTIPTNPPGLGRRSSGRIATRWRAGRVNWVARRESYWRECSAELAVRPRTPPETQPITKLEANHVLVESAM